MTINRRKILQGVTLGVGVTALNPFVERLYAEDRGDRPKRFVFVLKSSGLQGEYLNPEGLEHGGDRIVDESLDGRVLPESLKALEPLRDKLKITQALNDL